MINIVLFLAIEYIDKRSAKRVVFEKDKKNKKKGELI